MAKKFVTSNYDLQEEPKMTEEMKVESFVSEEDFPTGNSRLQELMSTYRQAKNLPEKTSSGSLNPLEGKKVKNEVRTLTFDALSPEAQERVLAMIAGVDYLNATDIQTFGNIKESPMTQHADTIISKYTARDAGELSDSLVQLVATMKTGNPQEIVKNVSVDPDKKLGFFSALRETFSLNKARKKMAVTLAEYDSIKGNIQAVEVNLEKQKLSLHKDINTYQAMGRATYEQVDSFGETCVALQLMIDDARHKLSKFTQKDELDLTEMSEAQNLQYAIERMERKLYSIQTIRTSTIQTIPQLAILIRGDEIICEKIDEVATLVIPLWTWQYAIAVGAIKQQEALSIQKSIREVTSKLLTGNAKLLHDNMIAAQEELYAAAVAIEDLQTVQSYIDDMVVKVSEKRKEASQKSVEGMKVMREIERKNYDIMNNDISEG